MTVPSHVQFVEALEKLKPHSPFDKIFIDLWVEFDESRPAIEIVKQIRNVVSENARAATQTVAMRWLLLQPNFVLARPRFFSDAKWPYHASDPDSAEIGDSPALRRIATVIGRYQARHGSGLPFLTGKKLRPLIKLGTMAFNEANVRVDWVRSVLSALDEYFYGDSTENIAKKKRSLQVNLRVAIDGLRALRQIHADPFAAQALSVRGREIESLGKIDDRIRDLVVLAELDESTIYPVHRGDSTARERLLVYRLAMQNQMTFQSSKSESISMLLGVEGIVQQIDERTIAKMCARFKESGWQLSGKI